MNIPPNDNWFDNFAFSCLAGFAGLLGHLMRSVNERRAITWERTLLETLASGFIGFLTVMLCRAAGVSYEWMGFIAGVLGWLGAATSMVLFERTVRKKLGLGDDSIPPGISPQTPPVQGSELGPASPPVSGVDSGPIVVHPIDETR